MKKVRKGDPLSIEARDWNRLVDSQNERGAQSPGRAQELPPDVVVVRNTLGRDLDMFAAVCIGSPLLTEPTTLAIDPIFGLVNGSLRGQQGYGQADPIVGILQEPIAQNRFGLARVSGVTPARVIHTEGSLGANSTIPEYATMSDDKDSLAFCQYGPIRVLQRNLNANQPNNFDPGEYILVRIGDPTNVGSCDIAYTTNWTNVWNEPRGWAVGNGDLMRLGVHGDGENPNFGQPTGKLYLSRPGRYEVTVEWRFSLTTDQGPWLATDRFEWRINWFGSQEYGGFTVGGWSATPTAGPTIRGERSFYYNLQGSPIQQEIQTPGIEARKVPASGSPTALTIQGGGVVRVVRYGPTGSGNRFWTKANRDASWNRGQTAGPI